MVRVAKRNTVSKRVGIVISIIQLILSIVLMAALVLVNMLPTTYLIAIGVVLAILFAITLVGQLSSKKHAITGKFFGILICIVLAIASFFVFKMYGTVRDIADNDNTKLDQVVVAVLSTDSAETLEDAKNYRFGVQYALKKEEMEQTIDLINEELNHTILTQDCGNVLSQAHALQDGQVQAIIYNEAYTSILEDEIENYSEQVRIIYRHEIETDMDNIKVDNPQSGNEPFAIYISGIDVYGDISISSRSDVNIIAVVNPETHQILLVTTPRDYYVPIPGVSNGVRDKLTHAGLYGIDASMAALSELYDIDLDYYFRVNFTSLVKMVDALGGITVYSNQSFSTVKGGYWISEGYNHLNGKEALSFARERKHVVGGDNQRGMNQQEVIKAMLKKALSPAILKGAGEILESVRGNMNTNMGIVQIQTLIKDQLATNASWSIKTMAAEGEGDSCTCYSIPYNNVYVAWPIQESVDEIKAAINNVMTGVALEGAEEITAE